MDTKQKLEYQQTVEAYLEENSVYDLFEHLLKELLLDRPGDPLTYLIHKLETQATRRIFLTGGSGSRKRQVGQDLAQRFRLEFVSVGTILKNEAARKTQKGEEIARSWEHGIYVPDAIVQELVFAKLEELEKREKGYILEGFPRTRVQALALQSAGLIPEKVVEIIAPKASFKAAFAEKRTGLLGDGLSAEEKLKLLDSPMTAQAAENALLEYEYHSRGVREVYRIQHHQVEGEDDQQAVTDSVGKLLMMRGRSSAPRRPPRVVILGPPGSGRSTQAQSLASHYGLVYVASSGLLRDQIERKTELGRQIAHLMSQGDLVPDQIMSDLIQSRLEETDCKVNGWVCDGYPKTVDQAMSLKHRGLAPTHVFFLHVYQRIHRTKHAPAGSRRYGPREDGRAETRPSDWTLLRTESSTSPARKSLGQTEESAAEGRNPRATDPEPGRHSRRSILSPFSSAYVYCPYLPLREAGEQGAKQRRDVIRKRLEHYKQHFAKLQAEYRRTSNEVKADMDPKLLTQLIGDSIENSIS